MVCSVVSIVDRSRYLLIKGMEELSKVLSDGLLEYVKYMISASTTAGRPTFWTATVVFHITPSLTSDRVSSAGSDLLNPILDSNDFITGYIFQGQLVGVSSSRPLWVVHCV